MKRTTMTSTMHKQSLRLVLLHSEHEAVPASIFAATAGDDQAARSGRSYWCRWTSIDHCSPAAIEMAARHGWSERLAGDGRAPGVSLRLVSQLLSLSFTEQVCSNPRCQTNILFFLRVF